jgi:hypothetical protein
MSSVVVTKREPFHYRFICFSLIAHCSPLLVLFTLPNFEQEKMVDDSGDVVEHAEVLEQNALTKLTKKAIETFPEEIMLSPEVFNQLPALIHEAKEGDVFLEEVYAGLQKIPKSYHQVVLLSMPEQEQSASLTQATQEHDQSKLAALLRLNRKLGFLEKQIERLTPLKTKTQRGLEPKRVDLSAGVFNSTASGEPRTHGVEVASLKQIHESSSWVEMEQHHPQESKSDAVNDWGILLATDQGNRTQGDSQGSENHFIDEGDRDGARALQELYKTGIFNSAKSLTDEVWIKTIDQEREAKTGVVINRIHEVAKLVYGSDFREGMDWGQTHLRFKLDADGYVDRVQIMRSSGERTVDRKAVDVLHLAEPYVCVAGWIDMRLPL